MQAHSSRHDHALDFMKGELEAEAGKREALTRRINLLENKLAESVDDNSRLQKEIEEHETCWADEREKLQADLKASTEKLGELTALISRIISSLFGTFNPASTSYSD
jgi:chromosome segregation ATPase